MVAKKFSVKYKPFAESDVTSEMIMFELDEAGVIDFFKRNYPLWEVVEIHEAK